MPAELVSQLPLLGISSAANLLSAIKMAKWYEWGEDKVVVTVLTDSMEMYESRLRELSAERGEFTDRDATAAYHQYLMGQTTDYVEELTYPTRRRVHNLKYYTWVEQQGKDLRRDPGSVVQARLLDGHPFASRRYRWSDRGIQRPGWPGLSFILRRSRCCRERSARSYNGQEARTLAGPPVSVRASFRRADVSSRREECQPVGSIRQCIETAKADCFDGTYRLRYNVC